jgi:acetyl-CoA synthetase
MTRGIWKNPQRYLETYWSRWPDVWVHGDWASVDEDGFWYLHGRSDDTLKIAGKRIGPAEIESALVSHPVVSEAAAIGIPHSVKGEVAVCLVILKPGYEPTEPLREELKHHVEKQLGKAFRPDTVKYVKDLPRTRNAKIMRRLIKVKYLGNKDLGDLSSLENPSALDAISQAL